jgi:hypothetical protein
MDVNFKELARYAARGTAPENFDLGNVNEAFRAELQNYCSSIPMFMKNRYDLYQIVIENADEIVPAKVIDALGIFAEVKQVGQNEKAIFKTSKAASKMRAKKFLTQVGLSGVYEAFRLDSDTFEVKAHAIGGAVTIDFERMLDGAETMAEVMEIITEGLTDAAYVEVQKALRAAVDNPLAPEANRVISATFEADKMFSLCTTVRNYANGGAAVIFAAPEFIGAMGPDAIVPVTAAGAQGIYHPQDIDAIHNQGYINMFRGNPVVQIPQSFVDTNNNKTWIDPQLAYVLPTGGERIVKIVLEGNTQMYDWTNADQSLEMHVYKKMGAAILNFYSFGIYQNTSTPQTMYNPYSNI